MKKNNALPSPLPALGWPPVGMPSSPFPAQLSNPTRRKSISVMLEPASTLLSRMRGLMFRKNPAALLFTFDWTDRHSIHSFFVAYPFDAIYLDENGLITDVLPAVPPFSPPLAPRAPSRYLIELPEGDGARLDARVGDFMLIKKRQCP